jgi:hypothetical protein
VLFRATSDQFDTGPFATGAKVAGRVLLDLDRPRLGPPEAPRLSAAVQDLRVTIGDLAFLADDADLRLTPIGSVIAVSARAGTGHGRVEGHIPGTDYALREIAFEARFPAVLFPDRLMELDLGSFTLLHLMFEFSHPTASLSQRRMVLGAGEFSALSARVVPVPGVAWLFAGASVLALRRRSSRRGAPAT